MNVLRKKTPATKGKNKIAKKRIKKQQSHSHTPQPRKKRWGKKGDKQRVLINAQCRSFTNTIKSFTRRLLSREAEYRKLFVLIVQQMCVSSTLPNECEFMRTIKRVPRQEGGAKAIIVIYDRWKTVTDSKKQKPCEPMYVKKIQKLVHVVTAVQHYAELDKLRRTQQGLTTFEISKKSFIKIQRILNRQSVADIQKILGGNVLSVQNIIQ
jgi:hypothetical protein